MAKKRTIFLENSEKEIIRCLREDKNACNYLKKIFNLAIKCNKMTEKHILKNELMTSLTAWGFGMYSKPFRPISKEEKKLIRMEFYGSIDRVDEEKLSEEYIEALNKKQILSNPKYNLEASAAWNVYSQSENFKKLEPKIKETMKKLGISPQIAKTMSIYEYSDIIFKTFQTEEGQDKVWFMEGLRQKFIKDFITNNEEQFRKIYALKGINQEYTDDLVKRMKESGKTDVILRDGSGRDRGIRGPILEVHHLRAVSDAGENTNIFTANDRLVLVVNDKNFPMHNLLHYFDQTIQTEDGKEFIAKRAKCPKNTVFIGGLSTLLHIQDNYLSRENKREDLTPNLRNKIQESNSR